MKVCRLLLYMILSAVLAGCAGTGDVQRYTQAIQNAEHHRLESAILGRDLHLIVNPPVGYTGEGDSYPVVFLLDGGALFPMLAGYYNYLRMEEVLPDMLVVGISYGAATFPEGNFRSSDYTAPSKVRDYYGGAAAFQQMLVDEVFPLIERKYHVDSGQRYLFGQSIGGQFVVYTAMTRPALFAGHIASNPALHNNVEYFLDPLFDGAPGALSNLIVIRGENDPAQFAEPAGRWVDHWTRHREQLPVRLETRVLPGYGHFSLAPESFRQGLTWLLEQP